MSGEDRIMELVQKNIELMDRMLKSGQNPAATSPRQWQFKDLVPSVQNTHTATRFHGVDSLFGEDCALERDILTSFVKPFGLLSVLPAVPSREEIIRQGTLTGFDPDDTEEPDYPCENAPRGTYSACKQEYRLGRIKRDSNTIEIDAAIRRAHRGDTDLYLRGSFIGDGLGNLGTGRLSDPNPRDVLNIVTMSEMQGIGINFLRELTRMVWQGDSTAPAPANTPNGGKKSFDGLDLFITTGLTDIDSGAPCPAMDSAVYDFNYQSVCDDSAAPFNIVQALSALEFRIRHIAEGSNLTPVRWVIAMQPALFQELSSCYPCMYQTDRCNINGNSPVVFNDGYAIRERDLIRNGMYLPINGINYPVILDFGIFEQNSINTPALAAGTYASSIYFIPLTVMGNFPVTWMRYQDYRVAGREMAALNGFGNFWTDDGRFMWSTEFVNFCFEITGKIEPGLVMRTPQLAFKIENVLYEPAVALRNPYPDDPNYL